LVVSSSVEEQSKSLRRFIFVPHVFTDGVLGLDVADGDGEDDGVIEEEADGDGDSPQAAHSCALDIRTRSGPDLGHLRHCSVIVSVKIKFLQLPPESAHRVTIRYLYPLITAVGLPGRDVQCVRVNGLRELFTNVRYKFAGKVTLVP